MARGRDAGFALPLTLVAAFGLLLGSLALQTVGLAGRQQTAVLLRLRLTEDGLASAAHRLVGTISQHHGCLLGLALDHWASQGLACAGPEALAQLRQPQGPEGPLTLLAWQPRAVAGAPAEVELLLEAPAAARPPEAGAPRAAFAFTLGEQPRRPLDLRALGLRGVAR